MTWLSECEQLSIYLYIFLLDFSSQKSYFSLCLYVYVEGRCSITVCCYMTDGLTEWRSWSSRSKVSLGRSGAIMILWFPFLYRSLSDQQTSDAGQTQRRWVREQIYNNTSGASWLQFNLRNLITGLIWFEIWLLQIENFDYWSLVIHFFSCHLKLTVNK